MYKLLILLFLSSHILPAAAQKPDSIYFHLYTDSLKKGFFNYINVDGKTTDGTWFPLDSSQLRFSANTGYFLGNDLFIDSSYTGETVKVKAILRSDSRIWKEITIYIRKRSLDEPLKTSDELLNEMQKPKRRSHLFGVL
jgi:hypothetical protein